MRFDAKRVAIAEINLASIEKTLRYLAGALLDVVVLQVLVGQQHDFFQRIMDGRRGATSTTKSGPVVDFKTKSLISH